MEQNNNFLSKHRYAFSLIFSFLISIISSYIISISINSFGGGLIVMYTWPLIFIISVKLIYSILKPKNFDIEQEKRDKKSQLIYFIIVLIPLVYYLVTSTISTNKHASDVLVGNTTWQVMSDAYNYSNSGKSSYLGFCSKESTYFKNTLGNINYTCNDAPSSFAFSVTDVTNNVIRCTDSIHDRIGIVKKLSSGTHCDESFSN
jgi:hypothetical protein